jgi:CRISPR-associated protein (TIGR03984 family)
MMDAELNIFSRQNSASECIICSDLNELRLKTEVYKYVVAYNLGGVTIDNADSYEPGSDLLELRAFDEDGELHLVFDGEGGFFGRERKDDRGVATGVATEVFDEEHLLWGEPSGSEDGKTRLVEEGRGTRILLPDIADSEGGRNVTILVRNYLSDDEEGQDMEFSDYRFVRFFSRDVIGEGE